MEKNIQTLKDEKNTYRNEIKIKTNNIKEYDKQIERMTSQIKFLDNAEKPDKLPAPTSESSTGKNLVNLESPAIIKMVLSTTERIPNLPFSIWEPALLGSATIAVPPSSSYNVGATGSSSLQEEKNITTATIGRINFLNAFIFKSFNS